MKRILVVLMTTIAFTQIQAQSNLRDELIDLESKGQIQKGVTVADQMLGNALKENNHTDYIFAAIYKLKFLPRVYELESNNIHDSLKLIIQQAPEKAKAALKLMEAISLSSQYRANKWSIDQKPDDGVENILFDEMSKHDYFRLVSAAIDEALKLAQKEEDKITSYKELFDGDDYYLKYFPKLIDQIFFQGIELLSEYDGNSYEFDSEQISNIQNCESTSMPLKKSLEMFGQWHKANASNLEILGFIELNRLEWINKRNNHISRFELYEAALKNLLEKYKGNEICADMQLALAQHYKMLSQQYNPTDTATVKYYGTLQQAWDISNEIEKKYPDTHAAKLAKNLKYDIELKGLSISTEQYQIADKNMAVSLSYSNLSKVKITIKEADVIEVFAYSYNINTKNSKVVYEEWFDLPKTDDYYKHTTTLVIPFGKLGSYSIEASTDNEIDEIATTFFHVTKMAMFTESKDENNTNVWLVDANNGKAVSNAKIEILKYEYGRDRNRGRQNVKILDSYTIKNGSVSVPTKTLSGAWVIRAINGNDTLLQNIYTPYYSGSGNQVINRIEMFTDREIYRPGQIIQVKGIWYSGMNEEWNVVPGKSVTLTVRDNVYKEISNYSVTTNDFGSFNFSVPIPEDIQPGYMTISTQQGSRGVYGSKTVRVESYRRYTFDAKFVNPDKTTVPGDEVVIKLEAETYSGVKLNTLKIVGDVKLTSRHIWWLPPAGKTVATIDAVADENGSVLIRFKSDKNLRHQTYSITATITTPAGESRDFNHSFVVSDHPYRLSLNKTKLIKGETLPNINIGLINGEKCSDMVELSLNQLSPPKNILLKSALAKPDKHSLSKEEWEKLMPQTEYSGELDKANYKIAKNIWSSNVNADKAEFPSDLQKTLDEGTYSLTMTVGGKKYTNYFTVVNPAKKGLALPEILDVYSSTNKATAGQEITITFVSAVKNIDIWYGISAGNKTLEQKKTTIKNGKFTVKFKVGPQHEGTLYVNSIVVYGGKTVSKTLNIPIERWSKQLQIETITMRNKIVPGEQETWKFKLKTPDGRPLDAEVVASMYDMSLDAFVPGGVRALSIHYPIKNTTQYNTGTNRLVNGRASQQQFYVAPPSMIHWNFLGYTSFSYGNVYFDTYRREPHPEAKMELATSSGETERIDEVAIQEESVDAMAQGAPAGDEPAQADKTEIPSVRTNFNETAFFYPFIEHDENGEFTLKFESPEAITSWRMQLFAHDKKLSIGYYEGVVQTQKPLMVMPVFPRFAYTGDNLTINVSVYNVTDSVLTLQTGAQITDTRSDSELETEINEKTIVLKPGENKSFKVTVKVPTTPGFLTVKIFAKAGTFTDGEEKIVPVFPNRQLVTNTMALWGKPSTTTEYKFDNLLPTDITEDSKLKLTFEMTTNPTWYAIQSLQFFDNPNPKSPFALVESIFGVQTGKYLINKYPEIGKTITIWQTIEPDALQSKLLTNKELKITDIEKTPWYIDATSEQEQKRKLGMFLDKNNIENLTATSIKNLSKMQHSSGGFLWVPGWEASTYVTLYVSEQIGRVSKIDSEVFNQYPELKTILKSAIKYLDKELDREFGQLLASKTDTAKYMTPYFIVRTLYVKSLVNSNFKPTTKAEKYYFNHAKKYALDYNLYGQAVLGTLARSCGDIKLATKIYKAIDGSAVVHHEKGVFWRQNVQGWEWYQAPISTQVRIMEFYQAMTAPTEKIEAMKIWLISNKRTHMWNDGLSTSEAVYALTTSGKNWLKNNEAVTITLSNLKIVSSDYQQHAGTGYFKTTFEGDKIPADIKTATINNPNSNPVYGGAYAQFYESFDKIKPWQQNLTVDTKLFTFTHQGDEVALNEVKDNKVKQGDKVRARVTITSDRELEYVVVQLPFPTCFEQVDQTSGFQWRFGNNHYIQNYDNRAEFLFYRLRQGVTVIEFDLYTLRTGEYLSAPTTVQSLYAPEFSAHTAGVRILVE
ncbi:MAG: MG2 domain-containing protein [Salinivirgaceae bacterium]|jgi:hypothetical protein|nr:hypothetical protein [Bacteroidales bacterium]